MTFLFFVMAFLIVLSAIAVVAFRNAIYSALALVVNLLTVAGLFAQLDAHFLSAVQIIVYAGAIMVLVLFVLMLLNLKSEEPKGWPLVLTSSAVVVGCLFAGVALPRINEAFRIFPAHDNAVIGTAQAIGKVLYTQYVFAFEIASVLIMAAIVGAIMLAKRQHKRSSGI